MIYMGFDLSLNASGVARYIPGQILQSRVIRPGKNVVGLLRLQRNRNELANLLPVEAPAVIAVEGYSMGSKGQVFNIGEWGGVAQLTMYDHTPSCTILLVPPSTLKVGIAGNGNAEKADVAAVVNRLMGISETDTNLTDAIGLALIAEAWHTGVRRTERMGEAVEVAKVIKLAVPKLQTPRKRTRPGQT